MVIKNGSFVCVQIKRCPLKSFGSVREVKGTALSSICPCLILVSYSTHCSPFDSLGTDKET